MHQLVDNILWLLTDARRIEKIRYTIPLENLKIEVDIYANRKIVAEVEIPSEDYKFDVPDWFEKENIGRLSF